jgi:general secretion pathway protein M
MNWRKTPSRAPQGSEARKLPPWLKKTRDAYAALAPRERTMVLAAAIVVGLAVLWWVLLAPALATLARVDAERAGLDAQWQQLMGLQQEAQALQAQPRISGAKARQALEDSVKSSFGEAARLQWAGERANVTLSGASGGAIAQWLARARADAKAVPVQSRLTRAAGDAVLWNGLISVEVPQP